MKFKVDGITDDELEMLIKHDNLINKDIYIYNNRTSTSINTTTSYNNNYISNKYYSSILYLLIKKGFTYYSEIKKLLGVTNNFHLPKMERDELIFNRELTLEEKNYLLSLYPNMPKTKINTMKVYELTIKAKKYYSQPTNYDLIKRFSYPNIDNYIILQKNDYEIKQREIQEKQNKIKLEEKQRIWKAFSEGIRFKGDEEVYYEWLEWKEERRNQIKKAKQKQNQETSDYIHSIIMEVENE